MLAHFISMSVQLKHLMVEKFEWFLHVVQFVSVDFEFLYVFISLKAHRFISKDHCRIGLIIIFEKLRQSLCTLPLIRSQ